MTHRNYGFRAPAEIPVWHPSTASWIVAGVLWLAIMLIIAAVIS